MSLDQPGAAMSQTGWLMHRHTETECDMFQVLGERGCGTNVVRKTITKSVRLHRTEALGWKHGFPAMVAIPRSMVVVCAFRNAFDWAASLYKRPWHADDAMQSLSFSEFLRAPWDGVVDRTTDFEMIHPELQVDGHMLQFDRHPIHGTRFSNIFEMRALKARSLLGMLQRESNIVLVRFEAFRDQPEAFVNDLSTVFDLAPTERGYRPITRNMGNRFRPTVRGREKPPEVWSDEDKAWAMSQLDSELEAALGYHYAV
ncbi:hypothetical protein [uncultured Tateyamaria sp.]|uniref:hypothetical protein n=1 Tax=uncultured Tateyamaria sp. TaxID=455651 RepID=UPI002618F55E|nr:hypothetical protein [uncultured Tateyamaria sp.]